MKVDSVDTANEVLKAKTAAAAKAAAQALSPEKLDIWKEHSNEAMYNVLKIKVQQSPLFLNALIDSGDSRLVKATRDTYWGIGLDIKFAANTHPDFYRGSNVLGSLLEKVRDEYITKDVHIIQSSSSNPDNLSEINSETAGILVPLDEASGPSVALNNSLGSSQSYDDILPNDKKKKRKLRKVKKSPRSTRTILRGQYYSIDNYLKQIAKKRKTLNVKYSYDTS